MRQAIAEPGAPRRPHMQTPILYRTVTPHRGNDVLSAPFCKGYISNFYISNAPTSWWARWYVTGCSQARSCDVSNNTRKRDSREQTAVILYLARVGVGVRLMPSRMCKIFKSFLDEFSFVTNYLSCYCYAFLLLDSSVPIITKARICIYASDIMQHI